MANFVVKVDHSQPFNVDFSGCGLMPRRGPLNLLQDNQTVRGTTWFSFAQVKNPDLYYHQLGHLIRSLPSPLGQRHAESLLDGNHYLPTWLRRPFLVIFPGTVYQDESKHYHHVPGLMWDKGWRPRLCCLEDYYNGSAYIAVPRWWFRGAECVTARTKYWFGPSYGVVPEPLSFREKFRLVA